MTYTDKLLILSLTDSFACFIFLIILYLPLANLSHYAKMLTAYQLLYRSKEGNLVPKQKENGNTGALYFVDIKVSLQQLTQILHQNFKLITISALAWKVYTRETCLLISVLSPRFNLSPNFANMIGKKFALWPGHSNYRYKGDDLPQKIKKQSIGQKRIQLRQKHINVSKNV